MIKHFTIISSGLIALLIAAFFGLGVYVLFITDNKLVIILIFIGIFLIDTIFGIYIANSKRYTHTKLCWVLALVYLPLIGVILFFIFGVKSLSEKTLKQHQEESKKYASFENFDYTKNVIENTQRSIFMYGYMTSLRPIYKNNDISIIEKDADLYYEMIKLIRSAKKNIHIQMYLMHDGFFLRTFFAELILKAKEGVKIRFLYDWYGSHHNFKKRMLRELKKSGIEVGIFNPKGFNMFKSLTNYRSHKKAVIIDNHTTFYGGSNIGDEYLGMDQKSFNWKDLNFIIKGEIVNTINIGFCNDWINYTSYSIKKNQKQVLIDSMKDILVTQPTNIGSIDMQMVYSSPLLVERSISDIIVELILRAKKNIRLVTPYFLPIEDVMNALLIAAKTGIKIELIFPGKRDNKNFILTMNRHGYEKLMELGCKIYEYHGFIHSKYLIIDDRFIFTGSNNLDIRSLTINFENCLLIENDNYAKQLINLFEKDRLNSKMVNINEINTLIKSFRHRWKIMLLNMYKPIL